MPVCASSMGRPHPLEGKPEGERGGRSWRLGRRGGHNNGMWGWGDNGGEREWEVDVKGMKLKISMA
jgi:hypothetical protein